MGIYAKKVIPGTPVVIELADFKTKEDVDVIGGCLLVATGPRYQNLGARVCRWKLTARALSQ